MQKSLEIFYHLTPSSFREDWESLGNLKKG